MIIIMICVYSHICIHSRKFVIKMFYNFLKFVTDYFYKMDESKMMKQNSFP